MQAKINKYEYLFKQAGLALKEVSMFSRVINTDTLITESPEFKPIRKITTKSPTSMDVSIDLMQPSEFYESIDSVIPSIYVSQYKVKSKKKQQVDDILNSSCF